MRQDEYLFNQNAICAIFRAIYSKIQCNLVLNAVQYAAKRSVFWCKMQCVLVLNAS